MSEREGARRKKVEQFLRHQPRYLGKLSGELRARLPGMLSFGALTPAYNRGSL
jgi:hypothetical protein